MDFASTTGHPHTESVRLHPPLPPVAFLDLLSVTVPPIVPRTPPLLWLHVDRLADLPASVTSVFLDRPPACPQPLPGSLFSDIVPRCLVRLVQSSDDEVPTPYLHVPHLVVCTSHRLLQPPRLQATKMKLPFYVQHPFLLFTV
jgi:hypothetical protein